MRPRIMRVVAVAVASLLVMASLALAQGEIERRQARQQKRIDQGVKSGELTRKEARKLEKREAKIEKDKLKAEADGKLTAKEKVKLNKELDKESRKIYRQKRDEDTRKKLHEKN